MREHVEKVLHTEVERKPVNISGLPLYLRGLYSLERWAVFGVPFVVATPVENPTLKTMTKHREALEATLGIPVAFALEDGSGYRIGRMLEAGLPFIAPGRQVYLPFLGIALSEERIHTNTRRQTPVEKLSPQAQRLALMALYGNLDGTSVTQAASLLCVAKMTASRSFDELGAAGPSLVVTEGRRRVLRPGEDKVTMWRCLKPYMSSPVVREHRLTHLPNMDLPLGGISALCELSMLEDNPWPTLVATRAEEHALGLAGGASPDDFVELDDPACVVQVVRYEPVPAPGCAFDPLSAILSLPDGERDDPRVAGEIESILNRVLGGNAEGNR